MTNLPKVLLFDDEESNIKLYTNYLKENFHIKGFQNPHHFSVALQEDVSAILIDVIMPVMNGLELFKSLQSHEDYNGCPVIFISATDSKEILMDALKCGGLDFLMRDMKKDEMVLRISNKVEYFNSSRSIFKLGNVKINTSQLKAYNGRSPVDLTLTEMKIMKFLIRNYPNLATREQINQDVWPNQKVLPTTLNTHFSNLRSKFSSWEYEIMIVKGKGVQLLPKDIGTA